MFSTMMTEASTMIPKSMAPIEIRLAESPRNAITMNVSSNESGTDSVTTSAARRSPRKAIIMRPTSSMPVISVCSTVPVVMWVNSVRS